MQALKWLVDNGANAIVVSGHGRHFCAGIDLSLLQSLGEPASDPDASCKGRDSQATYHKVLWLQDCMTAFEDVPVPTIAAVHGACIGAGVDLVTACDVRVASKDAVFNVKEAALAIVADMGTLQRLPTIVGHGVAMDLALAARDVPAPEALSLRLVSRVSERAGRDAVIEEADAVAASIASKSPLTIRNVKRMLLEQRHRSVGDGLRAVALLNSSLLPNADVMEVFISKVEGRSPKFSKL